MRTITELLKHLGERSGPQLYEEAASMDAEIAVLRKDAERYRWLKSERAFNEAGIFIARQDAAGIVRWNYEAADQLIDAEMRPLIDTEVPRG